MNPELPELAQGMLDAAGLEALFRDLAACAIVEELQVKGGAQAYATGAGTLEGAWAALEHGGARGVQLRYRFQGQDWVDTILRAGNGWRLVRARAPSVS